MLLLGYTKRHCDIFIIAYSTFLIKIFQVHRDTPKEFRIFIAYDLPHKGCEEEYFLEDLSKAKPYKWQSKGHEILVINVKN